MPSRRGFLSLAAALAAVVLPMLVLGVLQTPASDGRVVSPVTGTASTRSPSSPTGRGTHAGRTHAEPPGKGVRPRGPHRHRRQHRLHKRHVATGKSVKTSIAGLAKEKRSIAASTRSGADPGVTIADFSFAPGSITVHVGDTVQWVNNGPSAHTATANNGSFNTGVLQKGQSASVTFHLPGNFSYHCSIHPFMHGTVVVLASTKTSSSGSSGSSGSSPGSSGSSTSSSGANTGRSAGTSGASGSTGSSGAAGTPAASGQGTLPFTGVNVLAIAALGLLLSGSGLLLHWLRRRSAT